MPDEILKIETDKSVGLIPKGFQPTAELKVNEMTETIQKYPEVNRVQVISSEGEEFIWDEWDECSKVQVSFHNDGKTLKVFLVKEEN